MAGVINTTYTFTATDLVTSTKLNNLIDETIFTSDAITGTTLEVTGTGKLRVATGGITSNELLAASVTTAKLSDSNVTTAKIADSNVTTAKIADAAVTPAKLSAYAPNWNSIQTTTGDGSSSTFSFYISPNRASSGNCYLYFGAQNGVDNSAYILRATGANGIFTIANTGSGSSQFYTAGSLQFSIGYLGYSGYFEGSASAVSYNTRSDYRLKSNITGLDDQIANVMALNPVSYTLGGERRLGLIAHEVQELFPEAVSGEKDAVKADGTPDYQAIEYTALIPVLIAAFQSQQRQLDDLRGMK